MLQESRSAAVKSHTLMEADLFSTGLPELLQLWFGDEVIFYRFYRFVFNIFNFSANFIENYPEIYGDLAGIVAEGVRI